MSGRMGGCGLAEGKASSNEAEDPCRRQSDLGGEIRTGAPLARGAQPARTTATPGKGTPRGRSGATGAGHEMDPLGLTTERGRRRDRPRRRSDSMSRQQSKWHAVARVPKIL